VSIKEIPSDKICAVITSYFPDELLCKLVEQLTAQVGRIIIIDNTACAQHGSILNLLETKKKILILRNSENFGLGNALNRGIREAQRKGYTWVTTFDQDSEISPNLISLYQSFISSYPDMDKLGVVTANHIDRYSGLLGFGYKKFDQWEELPAVITSGCLFSTATFDQVNGFRENFLLDWVDIEFCLKIRQAGKHNYIYTSPYITHRLGMQTKHHIFFIEVKATHHSPLRCFLIGRNFMILIREYFLKETFLILKLMIVVSYKPISILFFEKNKSIKLTAFIKGIYQGFFRGPSGRLTDIAQIYSPSLQIKAGK